MAALLLAACNSNNKSAKSPAGGDDSLGSAQTNQSTATSSSNPKDLAAMKEIISQYLQIKNALSDDNGKVAALSGNAFVVSLGKMDKSSLNAEKKKIFEDIADDAKEMAEHIGANADKLEHQREHFEMLSKDMYDLVKTFGSGQVLYKDFCQMYNNGKGAFWLSETKEIKNPYMGKAMPTCGEIQEEIK